VSSTGNYSELLLPILTTILQLAARVVLLIVRRRSRSPYERAGGSGALTLPIHVRRSPPLPRAYFTLAAARAAALVRAHTLAHSIGPCCEVEVTEVLSVLVRALEFIPRFCFIFFTAIKQALQQRERSYFFYLKAVVK